MIEFTRHRSAAYQPGPRSRRQRPRLPRVIWLVSLFAIAMLPVLSIYDGVSAERDDFGSFPPPGPVLWSADQETGDLSQWTENQDGEAVFNTAAASVNPWLGVSHSGNWSMQLSVIDAQSQSRGARIFRWNENQTRGYYTAWLYFPQTYWPYEWWNVMQFKTKSPGRGSDPMWVLNVETRWDGTMGFYLWDAIHGQSYAPPSGQFSITPGQWVKVTFFYLAEQGQSGRIALWQNDRLMLDLPRVTTSVGGDVEWGVSNYTGGIDPGNAAIYVDDAEIRSVSE